MILLCPESRGRIFWKKPMEKSRCRWEDFVRRVVVDLLHVQNWKVACRYAEDWGSHSTIFH
jgi:hypothetical protein